jgi:hypothetical protein
VDAAVVDAGDGDHADMVLKANATNVLKRTKPYRSERRSTRVRWQFEGGTVKCFGAL